MKVTSKGKGPLQSRYSSSINSKGKLDATVRPSRHNLRSKTDLDKLVNLRKTHVEKLQNMPSLYGRQLEALDSEIGIYKTKIL
jgi:hypothetical protein